MSLVIPVAPNCKNVVSSVSSTEWHPDPDPHNHQPTGRWAEIQRNPNSSDWSASVVAHAATPAAMMELAMTWTMQFKPLARQHLNWFLLGGCGCDFAEDANIKTLLQTDPFVQRLFKRDIQSQGASGLVTGYFKLDQINYSDTDFQYAFGGIDRFDYEADFTTQKFHAWFQDRYEWHPYYPDIYGPPKDGDILRSDNCVHAAAVELKSGTARDYWMKGEARIPLSVILSVPDGPTKRSTASS